MLENFILAREKSLFLEQLEAGNIMDEAIVFIEDTKEIWNHGSFYGNCNGPALVNLLTKVPSEDSDLCTLGYVKQLLSASITETLNTEV